MTKPDASPWCENRHGHFRLPLFSQDDSHSRRSSGAVIRGVVRQLPDISAEASEMTTAIVSNGERISRARRYQLRHEKAGLCMVCPLSAVSKNYCARHAVDAREWQRARMKYKRRNLAAASYSFDKKKSVEDAIADVRDAINRNDTDAMKKTYDDLQNKFQEITSSIPTDMRTRFASNANQ